MGRLKLPDTLKCRCRSLESGSSGPRWECTRWNYLEDRKRVVVFTWYMKMSLSEPRRRFFWSSVRMYTVELGSAVTVISTPFPGARLVVLNLTVTCNTRTCDVRFQGSNGLRQIYKNRLIQATQHKPYTHLLCKRHTTIHTASIIHLLHVVKDTRETYIKHKWI